MNTSNKPLLQILVETLPKVGGWPKAANYAVQDSDGTVKFSKSISFLHIKAGEWCSNKDGDDWIYGDRPFEGNFRHYITANDWNISIVTREKYEAAMATSKELRHYQVSTEHYIADVSAGKTANATGANGWIDWHGGECPVDSDVIVEVKYRKTNPYQFNNDRAGDFTWSHHGIDGDIIAYRLVQPHEAQPAGIVVRRDAFKSNDAQLEADLNDCIGQPQSNDDARDEILYELANFAATTKTSLDIGVATEIAIWLSGKGYRKQ